MGADGAAQIAIEIVGVRQKGVELLYHFVATLRIDRVGKYHRVTGVGRVGFQIMLNPMTSCLMSSHFSERFDFAVD